MSTEIIDFGVADGGIDGLVVVTVKQVTDERGTIRELFRRSAFESAGVVLDRFLQINVTESRRGVIRGMHAEEMTKLLSVASGQAFGAYVDLRPSSSTYGVVRTIDLRPGIQILVPPGVANGFQALTDGCQYVYCFDAEWHPDMPGQAVSPLDPELAIEWPIAVDPDDVTLVSAKDRTAPAFADLTDRSVTDTSEAP
jgi:dTDP-4-dehydrorhamnose 3,5-epimerase